MTMPKNLLVSAVLNFMFCLFLGSGLSGCGAEPGSLAVGASCQSLADCAEGTVCLGSGRDASCAPICRASAGECGASASCGGVGVLEVNVCQEKKENSNDGGQVGADAEVEEQAHIPCTSDEECSALQSGAICAEWKGQRDCTLPCSKEHECDLPSLGGISIDFLTCISDAADSSRMACLPDELCFSQPTQCVDVPGTSGFDIDFGDF